MNEKSKIRFGVIGANHGHIYSQVDVLVQAGADLAAISSPKMTWRRLSRKSYPGVERVGERERLLDDPSIELIVSAAIPAERAPLGIEVMRRGKDFMSDKPGFTSLDQLAEARRVQAETGGSTRSSFRNAWGTPPRSRRGNWCRRCDRAGAADDRPGPAPAQSALAPGLVFPKRALRRDPGGYRFAPGGSIPLYTGSKQAEVLSAVVANYNHPQFAELEDFGEMLLRGDGGTGYMRVDWFTPDGLPVWGDGRLTILGSEGTIEIRKYIDLAGRPGGSHLFLTDAHGVTYIPCEGLDCPYAAQLLDDMRERSETAMPQAHVFLASELALRAEAAAQRLGYLQAGD